jgi:hypothetical protein
MTRGVRAILTVLWLAATLSAQEPDHADSREFNRALGVECTFCHSSSSDGDAAARATARRMIAMVRALNERLGELGGRVTCWTCHGGQRVPARIERARWEQVLADWPANVAASDTVKMTMAVYTASVGRRCAGCHDDGGAGRATDEAVHLVQTMSSLFPLMKTYVPETAVTQCFMCHKGRPHPQANPVDR